MVFKYVFNNLKPAIKKLFSEKGITLIEIVVVLVIMSLFSMILIVDYPKIQRQFALSRVSYKLAQDLRKAQDLGLSGSGVQTKDSTGEPINAQGYGIYFNLGSFPDKYLIYADVAVDLEYCKQDNCPLPDDNYCIDKENPVEDCVIEIIDVRDENKNLSIKGLSNINSNFNSTSINFTPPHPRIDIDNCTGNQVGIVIGLDVDGSPTRTVWVNTSGLIKVE